MFQVAVLGRVPLNMTYYHQAVISVRRVPLSPATLHRQWNGTLGRVPLSHWSPRGLSRWLVPVRDCYPTNRVIIINRNSCTSVFHLLCVIGS